MVQWFVFFTFDFCVEKCFDILLSKKPDNKYVPILNIKLAPHPPQLFGVLSDKISMSPMLILRTGEHPRPSAAIQNSQYTIKKTK